MDYKQTVEWLKSYKGMHDKIECINNNMRGVKGISYTNEARVTGKPKDLTDYMIEKEDLEKQMSEIEYSIQSVPNFYQRTVLEYKYINGFTFEKIANLMHYSISGVFKYHRKGIESICKECKKCKKSVV